MQLISLMLSTENKQTFSIASDIDDHLDGYIKFNLQN